MSNQPLITLSIVSHGDAKKIHRLLDSIQRHEPNVSHFQLILTDNLRNDLPDFDHSPWESMQIIRNEHPFGFAENHNNAFDLARARYFAILNPDLVFEQPVFEELINRLNSKHANIIAPQIVDANGTVQDSFRSLPTPLEIIRRRLPMYRFQPLEPDTNGLIHPDWIAAMFWLVPSNIYQSLNGMNEKYKLYFEDVDFCTRARLKGMQLAVDTRLHVQHNAQRSSRRNAYYLFLHTQSALLFFTSNVYKQARRKI